MRYEANGNGGIAVNEYLTCQMERDAVQFVLNEDGLAIQTSPNEILLIITNDGYIVMNLQICRWYSRSVSTFFREVLGKNLLVRRSRGNIRVLIYDDEFNWRSANVRYSRTDLIKSIAVFDIRLNPIAGLKKMAPKPRPKVYDDNGDIITKRGKTTSKW